MFSRSKSDGMNSEYVKCFTIPAKPRICIILFFSIDRKLIVECGCLLGNRERYAGIVSAELDSNLHPAPLRGRYLQNRP